MTCKYCEKSSHVYNMKCVGCLARHVMMMFYPEGMTAKQYCADLAKRYRKEVDVLINEVKKLRSVKHV